MPHIQYILDLYKSFKTANKDIRWIAGSFYLKTGSLSTHLNYAIRFPPLFFLISTSVVISTTLNELNDFKNTTHKIFDPSLRILEVM